MSVGERLQIDHPNHRILTIQSHVVHGYAGNRCSVFPLQLHGFEVDIINSVQFSNHMGYKDGVKGYSLASKDLAALYDGLKMNHIDLYSYIMSGYCGDASFLREICSIVQNAKSKNADLTYVCDPVLGDNGKYYVSPELCAIYQNEVFPLADIITPNAFELSELSGMAVESESDCLEACRRLHNVHPRLRLIVVTSGVFAEKQEDLLYCYASQSPKHINELANDTSEHIVYRFEIPIVEGHYVGTGDLFTSLLIVWLIQTNGDIVLTICRVINSLQALLRRTHAVAYGKLNKRTCRKS